MSIDLQTSVDWQRVDTVLLDMDGTILDLAWDNLFWTEYLPQRYARDTGLSLEESHARLMPIFEDKHGTLDWYCIDFWSRTLDMDIAALKREVAGQIAWLEGAQSFLQAVRAAGKPLWLVTNAHPGVLEIKLERTGLGLHFERLLSSHQLGYPKEDARFWPLFAQQLPVAPERALFVDDNLNVLNAAREFGIGQCVAISRPDSRHPPRDIGGEWQPVERLSDLLATL